MTETAATISVSTSRSAPTRRRPWIAVAVFDGLWVAVPGRGECLRIADRDPSGITYSEYGLYAASIVGDQVTLRWTAPAGGPPASGYVLRGGIAPGVPLVYVPTGSQDPLECADTCADDCRALIGPDKVPLPQVRCAAAGPSLFERPWYE
jgi:hypothetical protein